MWSEPIHHKGIHQDIYNYAKTFKYHHASLKPLDLPSVEFSGLLAWFSSAAELGANYGFPIRVTLFREAFAIIGNNGKSAHVRPPIKRRFPQLSP